MVFIALGSQKFQFNRLLKKVDEAIEHGVITEEVFAQSGASDYKPKHYQYEAFLTQDSFQKRIRECDMVITHGGVGIIISALNMKKKVLAVPRLVKYKEHVDDHQIQILKPFEKANYICVCTEKDDFEKKFVEAVNGSYVPYVSNRDEFIKKIKEYIESI